MESQNAPVVLINAFEVPAGADEEFIRGWEHSRDFLSQQPGYISTALHQSISPQADFRFVNVAQWESAESFQAAIAIPGFQVVARMPFANHPALYRIVRRNG